MDLYRRVPVLWQLCTLSAAVCAHLVIYGNSSNQGAMLLALW